MRKQTVIFLQEFRIKDEKTIIRKAQKGDLKAFEVLVNRYQKRVLSTANRIVNNTEDARDVSQEVFIRLYRYLPKFRNEKRFFTWLYRIVVNASYDHLKKENRFKKQPLEDNVFHVPINTSAPIKEENEIQMKVIELMEYLSSVQKTAFILREVEGLSCREIARAMDCPEGTIRSHLHYARKKLRDLLEQHYPELLEGIVT